MTHDTSQLLAQALQLPEQERADLAAELLDSLDPATDDDVEKAWAAEIKRRLDEIDNGQATTISWQEARKIIQDLSDDGSAN